MIYLLIRDSVNIPRSVEVAWRTMISSEYDCIGDVVWTILDSEMQLVWWAQAYHWGGTMPDAVIDLRKEPSWYLSNVPALQHLPYYQYFYDAQQMMEYNASVKIGVDGKLSKRVFTAAINNTEGEITTGISLRKFLRQQKIEEEKQSRLTNSMDKPRIRREGGYST